MVCSTSLLAPLDSLLLSLTLTSLIGQNFFLAVSQGSFILLLTYFFFLVYSFFGDGSRGGWRERGETASSLQLQRRLGLAFLASPAVSVSELGELLCCWAETREGRKLGPAWRYPRGKCSQRNQKALG